MLRLSKLFLTLAGALVAFGVQAQDATTTTTTETTKTIINSAPPVATCKSVAAHWEGSVWIDTHDVCKYENRTEGVAWINDYWSCTAATADGKCTTWALVPGHWVATLP